MSTTEITVFRKTGGILSKRISLKEGKVNADGSHCRMSRGEARRAKLNGVASLAELMASMGSHEALALGRLRSHLPDPVPVVLKRDLDGKASTDSIARSGDYLHFVPGKPAYLLLDHDRKGMPPEVASKVKQAGGFWSALVQVVPALAGATYVQRASTSAGLFNRDTMKWLKGSKGEHIYIAVGDGADIERALNCLHQRLWLAGYGFHVVGAAGQLLDRSIIDATVYGPERLVFEGAPVLVPPVAQSVRKRRPQVHEGGVIDSMAVIANLSDDEGERLAILQAASAVGLKSAAGERRKQWARAFAERRGLSEQEAERIAAQAVKHVLAAEFELEFDDHELGRCTVADVVGEPSRYIGETLADPLEGVGYGRGKAKVLCQDNRCLMIRSFAHGGINYQLAGQGVRLEDFRAYKPAHNYIYTPAREPWPAASVNATIAPVKLFDKEGNPILDKQGKHLSIPASQWLDQHQSVEQMTWAPGWPMLIEDYLIAEGAWVRRNGVTTFNLYLPPSIELGDPDEAGPWLEHVHKIYPNDAEHIINWLAQRLQHPGDKINHALVLGGNQGIGKDTLLEPIKHAVGAANFHEVSPKQVMGRFNGFLKSVILRINEARDLGEYDRYAFYDHMKAYTAAPPDVLRVDEKNLREYRIVNCCGVVITTNHKSDGIHLTADDRRHYVAWSELSKDDFPAGYWKELWSWYRNGGSGHVATYLMQRDISKFDAKAPPAKTEAFWAIADSGRAPEEDEMADVLDALGKPDAVTLTDIAIAAGLGREFSKWLDDRKNNRIIPHRLEACGYVRVRNEDAKDGQWKVAGRRQAIYARAEMAMAERVRAARTLVRQNEEDVALRRQRRTGGRGGR
jgi:hypothetical protein